MVLKHPKEAHADYNTAIQLRPDFAQAYLFRGMLKMSEADHVNALQDYNTALSLDKTLSDAYFQRSQVKSKLGYPLGAILDDLRGLQQLMIAFCENLF